MTSGRWGLGVGVRPCNITRERAREVQQVTEGKLTLRLTPEPEYEYV